MTKTEILNLIDTKWKQKQEELDKEFYDLFGVKDGNLPTNPEWKGWMLGIQEGVNRVFGELYYNINNDIINFGGKEE